MKKIYLLSLLFFSLFCNAQSGITYQAVLLNPKGKELPGVDNSRAPLVNKDICLRFKIIKESSLLEYQETITTNTDEFGMVNVVIGTGIKTDGSALNFASINWDGYPKNLVVELDTTGKCSDFLEISNQPFTSVPFALYAANSGTTGATGPAGPQGLKGDTGASGPIGSFGLQGIQGLKGEKGDIGLQGSQGLKGDTGGTGPQGLKGEKGDIGLQGSQGLKGDTGGTGPQGLKGDKGDTGIAGINGTNGSNALIKTTVEPAGANCSSGGTRIEVGLDSNKNSVLDDTEVNASQTKYVCNGAQGATGTASSSIGANAAFSDAISTYYKPLGGMNFKLSANGKYIIFANPNYGFNIGTTTYNSVGEVYVMKYENGIYEQVGQKIQGIAANDFLGGSVGISMDGTTILCSYNDNNTQNTKIFKFVNNLWVLHSTIQAGGLTLSNDGNVMTTTIWNGNNSEPVLVDIYRLNGANWDKSQLTASDILGYADSSRISDDGNTIALANVRQNGIGRIAIYKYINNAWGRIGNYIDGPSAGMQENLSLSKDGSKIVFTSISTVVGTYPVSTSKMPAYIKTYSFINNNWQQYGNDIELPYFSTSPFLSFNSSGDALLFTSEESISNFNNSFTCKKYFGIFKFSNGNWNQYGSRIDLYKDNNSNSSCSGVTWNNFSFESNIFMFIKNDILQIKDYN